MRTDTTDRNRCTATCLALTILILGSLACNAPTPMPSLETPSPSITSFDVDTQTSEHPDTEPSSEQATTPSATQGESEPNETTLPSTDTQSPPTETTTPTSTATPGPTATATSTPTLTAAPMGDPLVIIGQGYEITDWREAPDSDDWEGHLRITFTGGAPPFLYALENSEPQSDNLLYLRWLRCHDAPLTVHVWSADGQEAHKSVWVVSPYCP